MTTVAITTSRDRFDEASRPFAELGFTPVALPCITVETADEDLLAGARLTATGVDLLFITSTRTIRLLWPDGDMPAAPVAAIGAATARAVTEAGGNVAVIGDGGGLDLIERARTIPGVRRGLFPHAEGTDPTVLAAFRTIVPIASTIPIYRTVPIAPGPDPVEAVIFASASAVEGWFLTRYAAGLTVAAIGGPTAAALAVRGVAVDAAPKVPGFMSMAAALKEVIT